MNYTVCLTVYGRSRYLDEQLNSILNQSLIPSQIIVVEDYSGSSIKDYLNEFLYDKKIPYKIFTNTNNLGPAESFRQAMLYADCDIIYFADHDDIWHHDRVLNTIDYHNHYFLVICNAKVFYEYKKISHPLYKSTDFNNINIFKLFFKNLIVGATTSVNIANYRNLINSVKFEPMHDWILAIMSVILKKKIKFIDTELVSYRRHSKTLTGRSKNSIISKINYRIKILKFIYKIKKLIRTNN